MLVAVCDMIENNDIRMVKGDETCLIIYHPIIV